MYAIIDFYLNMHFLSLQPTVGLTLMYVHGLLTVEHEFQKPDCQNRMFNVLAILIDSNKLLNINNNDVCKQNVMKWMDHFLPTFSGKASYSPDLICGSVCLFSLWAASPYKYTENNKHGHVKTYNYTNSASNILQW